MSHWTFESFYSSPRYSDLIFSRSPLASSPSFLCLAHYTFSSTKSHRITSPLYDHKSIFTYIFIDTIFLGRPFHDYLSDHFEYFLVVLNDNFVLNALINWSQCPRSNQSSWFDCHVKLRRIIPSPAVGGTIYTFIARNAVIATQNHIRHTLLTWQYYAEQIKKQGSPLSRETVNGPFKKCD